MSAMRAGFPVRTADLFADRDLAQAAAADVVQPYPEALPNWLARQPAGAWLFTGALENRPDLLRVMAAERRLWGCSPESVQQVRDPWRLSAALTERGLASPQLARPSASPGLDSRRPWLLKPRRSAAGRDIVDWFPPNTAQKDLASIDDSHYVQQRIQGQVLSGAYLASQGACALVGLSESWHGRAWMGMTATYAYGGSLAPADVARPVLAEAEAVGGALVDAFGLVGWFGVDLVLAEGRLWVLEVNPRFTASMELHDRLGDTPLFARHVAACEGQGSETTFSRLGVHRDGYCGKAILHADRTCRATPALHAWADQLNLDRPAFQGTAADLPHGDQAFTTGQPIMTFIVEDSHAFEVERQLRALASEAPPVGLGARRRRTCPDGVASSNARLAGKFPSQRCL